MVSRDAAIAPVLSELWSISSSKDEQTTTVKAFPNGKDVLSLLRTGFFKSLIYQLAPLVIWFVDLIGQNQSTIDVDRWFTQSCAK